MYDQTVVELVALGYRVVLSNEKRSIFGLGRKRCAYNYLIGKWINYTMPTEFTLLESANL